MLEKTQERRWGDLCPVIVLARLLFNAITVQ